MQITVKNMAAVQQLDCHVGPGPNVIAGSNEAGKSTVLEVVAALLTRDAKIGRNTGEIAQLIRQGARGGTASIGDGEGKISCRWPDPELQVEGDPPVASMIAAGLVKPARLKPKERAAVFVEALKALPTKAEWLVALKQAGLSEEVGMKLWEKVDNLGWDGAADAFKKKATEGKGAWKQVTNSPGYPSKGAETWQVNGYDDDLMTTTVEACNVKLAELTTRRDKMVEGIGAQESERTRLAGLADQLDARQVAADDGEAAYKAALEAFDVADKELQKLTRGQLECRCPHCNLPVVLSEEAPFLVKPDPKAPATTTDPAVYDAKVREVGRLEQAVSSAEAARTKAELALVESQQAYEALKKLPPPRSVDTSAIDAEIETAKKYREAVRVTHEAMRIHREVVGFTKAAELAGPMGLRKTKLANLIGHFNDQMAELCELAGWKTVAIDEDLNITAGPYAWVNLSEGAQWRVDAVIALYFAERDGSHVVLLDRADVLDAKGRNGLLTIAGDYEIPVILGMTLTRTQAQQIAGAGIPVTFIHEAVGEILGTPAMAAE